MKASFRPILPALCLRGICLCLFFAGASLSAQTAATAPKPAASAAPKTAAAAAASTTSGTDVSAEAPAVPGTYRELSLGMTLDAVKEALLKDGIFGYRGERDVSLLPTMNRSLIETVGYSFITRSWFQFFEEKLYIMTFNLDPDKIDYFSVYSGLVKKYGEPTFLDPHKAMWGDEKVTLSLERPLTVKYVDAAVFAGLLGQSGTDKAVSDMLREDFINEF